MCPAVVKIAEVDDGVKPRGELDRTRRAARGEKRIRLLEQENEVLRRAAAYLSRGVLRSPK
jgi:hypothetical protein